MKNWEYKVLDSKDIPRAGILKGRDRSGVENYLNSLGREGWELVNIDFRELEGRFEFTAVAKREIGGQPMDQS